MSERASNMDLGLGGSDTPFADSRILKPATRVGVAALQPNYSAIKRQHAIDKISTR
jgi:hypothetical protein